MTWQTDKGWQRAEPMTADQIREARSGWRGRTHHNVGLRTGAASGFFVLDVDPDSGGDASLADLLAKHGALPRTYTVRTGSGGTHYYWRLPEFPVGNSAKGLGKGLDIRGEGGQVVAPPSVSAKGPYSVAVDAPVAEAPVWLLDRLRPAAAKPSAPSSPG